jgi:hypothetical protein
MDAAYDDHPDPGQGENAGAGGAAGDALVARMQRGDREAAAEFLALYRPLLMRRLRGQMTHSVRRLWDSDDLYSTLGRRLDALVLQGRIDTASTPQLIEYLVRIGENAVKDRTRRAALAEAALSPCRP